MSDSTPELIPDPIDALIAKERAKIAVRLDQLYIESYGLIRLRAARWSHGNTAPLVAAVNDIQYSLTRIEALKDAAMAG